MPSHDRKAARSSAKGSAKPRVSMNSLPPEVFGIYGGIPRNPAISKRPLLIRRKTVVLIPPRKPQVQKQRSRYDSTASSIRNQLRMLEMQIRFLSGLIDKTLPVDTVSLNSQKN